MKHLALALLWLTGCSAPATRARPATVQRLPAPAPAPRVSIVPGASLSQRARLLLAQTAPLFLEEASAEPAGEALDEATEVAPTVPEPSASPIQAMVDADACPSPIDSSDTFLAEYDAFVDKAVGFPPGPDEVIAVKVSPSLSPIQTLALARGKNGTYLIRTKRLNKDVWAEMMREMSAQHGGSFTLEAATQTSALERLEPAVAEVRELPIDRETAKLMMSLWRSLKARAQIVHEVGIMTGMADGTGYEIWQQGRGIAMLSPANGTVLGKAVSSIEHLAYAAELGAGNEENELMIARTYMEDALERTRQKEPCLKPYHRD